MVLVGLFVTFGSAAGCRRLSAGLYVLPDALLGARLRRAGVLLSPAVLRTGAAPAGGEGSGGGGIDTPRAARAAIGVPKHAALHMVTSRI